MNISKILVATDFTVESDRAIEHAIVIAKASSAQIFVLHVVKEDKETSKAKMKIQAQVEGKAVGVEFSSIVRVGSFISEIGHSAAEVGANIIIMGTHGAKGVFQKTTGGDAMKVVSRSEKSFIVVQDKGVKSTGYDDIIVPLDMTDDSKQKLDEVADIAKYFNSKVHIIARFEKDSSLFFKLKNNVKFAKKYFAEKGLAMNVIVSDPKAGSFDKQMMEYAKEVDADLIAIINSQKWNVFGGLFSNKREDEIITNSSKIPVLCVNPIDVKGDYSM